MGKIFDRIDDHQREWIARQRLFFVGSAPLDGEGHVNVSPKGPIDTLKVLDDHSVAYLDMVGSGAETVAHLRENGRIVVMLCAFEGPPRILRLHGRGEIVEAGDRRFEVKRALHRAGVMTVEQLSNLESVEGKRWHLFAAPLRVRGMAARMACSSPSVVAASN